MMKTTLILLTAVVLLAGCNQYDKTRTGLVYKITKGGSNEKLKNGQFIKFDLEYKISSKDTVLTTSYGRVPGYLAIDTSKAPGHNFLEVITRCAVGDKIEFSMSVDTLKKMEKIQYNNIFHPRDIINGRVDIRKVFANQQEASDDLAKEQAVEKQREIKELQDFTAKKGIKTQSTPSGALVDVKFAGEPQKADSGKQIKVLYKGTLLNGKVFDSNMDKNTPGNLPLTVVVGTNGVILGMDEAFHFFGKGGKGTMYIPAMLAYGQNGSAPVIGPWQNLVFEIEVLDVSAPTPPATQPPMGAPQKK